MDPYETVGHLIESIEAGLARRPGEGVAASLGRLRSQDLSQVAFRPTDARRVPACRYLPQAVAATLALDSALAAAIAEAEDALHWRQNPNYSDAAMGQFGYMDRYAYAELIGPTGAFAGDDFLLGLLLLGPDLHYPDHAHPAPELYWLLTGPSEWRRAAEPFAERAPGDTIWHPSRVVHATRTGAEPLLAVWFWTRDVSEPARLV